MENTSTLASLEATLRREALEYLSKCEDQKVGRNWICSQFLRVTGCQLANTPYADALDKVSRLLAAQNRWSRIKHPRYDINRHITLRKLKGALVQDPACCAQLARGQDPFHVN